MLKLERLYFLQALYFSLLLVFMLWMVEGFEYVLEKDFRDFGIYPRSLSGSVGIITSPWIHNDVYHLFSNSFPLLFLGIAIGFFYRNFAVKLLILMYFLTGLLVWLFGREAFHIGASGMIYAMIGFLLFSGAFRKEPQSAAIALAFLFLYGGVLEGMFPTAVKPNVSWESHLLGGVAGAVLAFYFRNNKGSESLNEATRDGEDPPDSMTFTEEGDFQYTLKKEQ